MRKKIYLIIFAVIVFLIACDPHLENRYTLTFELENGVPDIVIKSDVFIFPDEPERLGYEFVSWTDEEGKAVNTSSLQGKELDSDHTFRAEYELLPDTYFVSVGQGGGDGSEESPLTTISSAIDQGASVILLNEGTYDEDIVIPDGKKIAISGNDVKLVSRPAARTVNEESAVISGTITIGDSADVRIDNVKIVSDVSSSSLIYSESSKIKLTVTDTSLFPVSDGRAIYISIDESAQSTDCAEISLDNVYVELSGSIGSGKMNGIFFDGDSSREKSESELPEIDLQISNTCIVDISSEKTYVYPLGISRFGKVDALIENVDISVQENHYPVWVADVGSSGRPSNITITGSTLSGYCAYYERNVTNLRTEITESVLIGKNYNDGESSGFYTISFQYPTSSSITVKNSEISFEQLGESSQGLAELSWVMDTSYADNLLEFIDCEMKFNEKPEAGGERILYCLENGFDEGGADITNNRIIIDDKTMDSLLGGEYTLLDLEAVDYGGGVFSTATVMTLSD